MAQAKRPKKQKEDDARTLRLIRAQQLLKVTPQGTDVSFLFPANNIPMAIHRKVKSQTGKTIDALAGGLHGFVVFWWVTRLIGGEDVTLPQVEADWDEQCAGTTLATSSTEWVTADALAEDADPEA